MKKHLLFSVATFMLLFFSNTSFSQNLDLGTLSTFEAYTGAGAITNEGIVKGDAGSNNGIISGSGFGTGYTGTAHRANTLTVQARIDLLRVYIHLSDIFVTKPGTHAPAFGNAETIYPGVYSIGGAGSIAGTLTLDGEGNTNAVFIMKFDGALTAGVASKVVLTNGTRAANVFWIAEGAISVGSDSEIKGTLFSHPGAISLGLNCKIEGRLLASEGAITVGAGSEAVMPAGPISIPIKCLGFCSPNSAVDVLGSISGYALFTSAGAVANAATSGIVGDIGTDGGTISGFGTSTQVGFVNPPGTETAKAKQDLENAYKKLIAIPVTVAGHSAAFGSGETVYSGVYGINGAGSLAGTVTLDAQNDPKAIFVFKFNGAFSVAAQSKVILINGARRCNIFWISEGAIDLGTFTYMKGTLLAHGGACSAGANSNIEGRMLSTAGAIGFSTGVIYNDTLCFGVDDTPVGKDQEVCLDGTSTQTLTATATNPSSTNQTMKWYTASTGGSLVSPPSQIGKGTVTYYAESFNGAYSSKNRAAVTLTIKDCSIPDVASIAVIKVGTINDIAPLGVTNPGDKITYAFQIKNTGNTNLTDVVITDPMVGLTISGNPIASLAAGTTSSLITATYTITQSDIDKGNVTNSATAAAKDPKGNKVTDVSGTAFDNNTPTVTPLTTTPTVALVKTASVSGKGILGDVITYTFTVTNTGNTSLSNIVITDPLIGLIITGNPIATLTIGASDSSVKGTHTITQADIDAGKVINSATATATDPKGVKVSDISGTANDNNTPTVTTLKQSPAIALVKSARIKGSATLGDLITYIFKVTNTGNVTLNNVVLTDPLVGLTITGSPIASLAPGTVAIAIGSYTIIQTDINARKITNSAKVVAKDPNGIDTTDISGTAIDNDDPTVTPTGAVIAAIPDKAGPINGVTGSTNVVNVLTNDTLNGAVVKIADVNLTTFIPNSNLKLNNDGSVDVLPNTPAGTQILIYQICDKIYPANCYLASVTVEVIKNLTDFTPTINIESLLFLPSAPTKDFVVNILEIGGSPSVGQVVVKVLIPEAFTFTYGASTTNSKVSGGVAVNNKDWIITDKNSIVTMTLKPGVVIGKSTFSAVGFSLTLRPNMPSQTIQPITVSIVNSSGSDGVDNNSTYNINVKAQ